MLLFLNVTFCQHVELINYLPLIFICIEFFFSVNIEFLFTVISNRILMVCPKGRNDDICFFYSKSDPI